jgi:glycosyltransferase involved in cell wall biosynthesis
MSSRLPGRDDVELEPASTHTPVSPLNPAHRRARPFRPAATVVIPAFNEEAGLPVVLQKLLPLAREFQILVVDDGSTDRTSEAARDYGCSVVRHPRNRGKGAAIRTAVKMALSNKIILIDADDTYPVREIPTIADQLVLYDMVLGVRTNGRNKMPPLNRLGNAFFHRLIWAASGFSGTDPLTGLYGIRKQHLERMRLVSNGFGIEAEIAVKAGRMGLRIHEHPISYSDRVGETKLRPIRDGVRIALTVATHARYAVHRRCHVALVPVLRQADEDEGRDG